jgi:hypothetical protein
MVRVCDALMGSGKTESTIRYINEHPDEKYIFITPYLAEAERIKTGCPDARFVEPSNKIAKYDFKKGVHTAALIKDGRNIATTHQAFKCYTQSMLDDIRNAGYTLFIDENVDVIEKFDYSPGDLQMAVDAGYIRESNGVYSLAKDVYNGAALRDMFRLLRSRDLVRVNDESGNEFLYWTLPPELIYSFKDVYILTYLFEGQGIFHFLQTYKVGYDFIGIMRTEDGGYRFCERAEYLPAYAKHLREKLHILEGSRINDIGDAYHALSMNWFKKNPDGIEQLKKNMQNYFTNIKRSIPAERRLWGAYNSAESRLRGKGYTNSFLTFNAKATNAYRDKYCLAYVVNLFMSVGERNFYEALGIEVDEDKYALSIMVQWIWRSAIRDGKDVWLYIPSKRMRDLLTGWIDDVSKEANAFEV